MENIVFTFIIPHKNCPDLLRRCVESIPERENVQIIVIDDNSDANKKPDIKRKNVEIIFLDAEQSKGAGRARNVGIERAKGKWLLFADADDYYTENLPLLLNKYNTNEVCDIVYLNACKFDENGLTVPFKTEQLIKNYQEGIEDAEMHLRYDLWSPWSRMVKRELVQKHLIKFDEIPAGNDLMFCLNCSKYASKISTEKMVIYNYYKDSKGSVTDKARKQFVNQRIDLRGRMISLYQEVGYKHRKTLIGLIVDFVRWHKMTLYKALKEYYRCSKEYNISILSDMLIYTLQK